MARTTLVVDRELGADVIFGAAFIDKFVGHISTRRRTVLLANGDTVSVI